MNTASKSISNKNYLGQRYEFKFVVTPHQAELLQNYIESVGLQRDVNSSNGAYIVNSLYFETPLLDDYYDKDASLLIRKKMRARMYDASWSVPHENVWVEVKGKRNFYIRKSRAKVTGESFKYFIKSQNPNKLLLSEGNKKEKEDLKKFSYLYVKGRYSPHIIIKYERLAFTDTFTNPIRVTFDSNIRTCFAKDNFNELFMDQVFPDNVVMECKFVDSLPWWFKIMIDRFNIKRTDFSKYNHSVATLRHSYRIPVSR